MAVSSESDTEVSTTDQPTTGPTTTDEPTTIGPSESDSDSDSDSDSSDSDSDSDSDTTAGTTKYCKDGDNDGFGDPEECIDATEPPDGYVPDDTDCDDEDANTHPGAAENEDPEACTQDADDDGWGNDMPGPGVDPGSDCNDANENTFPGAAENDDPDACMEDDDMDGWGDPDPDGDATIPGSDCNDEDASVLECELWCADMDADTYGDPDVCVAVVPGEDPPMGYVMDSSDCLDSDPNAFPGAAELDNPEACMLDADGDGWGDDMPPAGVDAGRDCDDGDLSRVLCVDAAPACVDTTLGGDAQLMAMASGGDGNYSVQWTPADSLSDATIFDPIANPTDITTYTVNVTDGANNMGSDVITVHLTDKAWVLGGMDAECEAVGLTAAPAAHSFAMNGTTTCTTSNADPTVFICPTVHEQSHITGTFGVTNDGGDDDWIGFVWGWQSAEQFYMFHWKRDPQQVGNCNGERGMVVKKVDAVGALTIEDLGCVLDTPNVEVLLTPGDIYDQGWINGREYGVDILYDQTQTEITITDLSDNSLVTNFVMTDPSYPSGKFGTYDWSQINACNGPWMSSCL